MISVEAHKGIGMKDFRYGEPLSRKTLHELPGHPAPLTATPNHMQPAFAYLEPKTPEAGEIARYSVIVEVTLHHTLQPSPDFRQRLMHAHPQGSFHLIQLGEKSLPDSFAQHEELPILPRLSANMRKPKEVERLRLALTPSLPVSGRKPPELNQAGLARMEFQTELLQPLPPFSEEPFRVRAIREP